MQDLRNECFKILEALATDGNFPCGDNDLVEAPSRAIKQIAALQARIKELERALKKIVVAFGGSRYYNEDDLLSIAEAESVMGLEDEKHDKD